MYLALAVAPATWYNEKKQIGVMQMKLLIAEDDARLLKSLLHVFTINKFSADGVSTGTEALEYALTGEYDGLILDIMMPGMDGIEVLKTLRRKNITS